LPPATKPIHGNQLRNSVTFSGIRYKCWKVVPLKTENDNEIRENVTSRTLNKLVLKSILLFYTCDDLELWIYKKNRFGPNS